MMERHTSQESDGWLFRVVVTSLPVGLEDTSAPHLDAAYRHRTSRAYEYGASNPALRPIVPKDEEDRTILAPFKGDQRKPRKPRRKRTAAARELLAEQDRVLADAVVEGIKRRHVERRTRYAVAEPCVYEPGFRKPRRVERSEAVRRRGDMSVGTMLADLLNE